MVIISLFSLFIFGKVQARLSCFDVPFLTRSEWRAGPPKAIASLAKPKLSFYVIHHIKEEAKYLTFSTIFFFFLLAQLRFSCFNDETCSASLRSIQQRHQNNLTWVDIGFHFIIGENGKVYEGRGWRREGAHSRQWNRESFGEKNELISKCFFLDCFSFGLNRNRCDWWFYFFNAECSSSKSVGSMDELWRWSWICRFKLLHYEPFTITTTRSHNLVRQCRNSITFRFHSVWFIFSPGFGILQIIQSLPRFCPFENQDFQGKLNGTKIALVENYCREKLRLQSQTSSRAVRTYFYTCLFIIFLLAIEILWKKKISSWSCAMTFEQIYPFV